MVFTPGGMTQSWRETAAGNGGIHVSPLNTVLLAGTDVHRHAPIAYNLRGCIVVSDPLVGTYRYPILSKLVAQFDGEYDLPLSQHRLWWL